MFKKYLHPCSSYTNANNFLGKHVIEYFTHYSDRIRQFIFLLIYETYKKMQSNTEIYICTVQQNRYHGRSHFGLYISIDHLLTGTYRGSHAKI